jgi:CelD/BcsL family acetyltransferase involved in cellulose biosynthesis
MPLRFELGTGPAALARLGPAWDATGPPRTPFTTHEWLSAWWAARGRGDLLCPSLWRADGRLAAAACLVRTPAGRLRAVGDLHSGEWDIAAADEAAARELWRAIAGLGARRLSLPQLPEQDGGLRRAREALRAAGWRTHAGPREESPYLRLPDEFAALLAGRSPNLRSQYRRRRRALQREGRLVFRTTTGGSGLDRDLRAFFAVEGSGWKRRAGTAILLDPSLERLYASFARAAADRGWLRLHLLELDGVAIAGDLGCAISGVGYCVKTGFDEGRARLSPGLVLRGEILRSAVAEGLHGYDFLGGPDGYKRRWADTVRPRVTLHAYRGAATLPGLAYRRAARPVLERAARRLRR